jgi:type IV secretion system protein VirB1
MSAIVIHESGGRPFAIGDNTARRSYDPGTALSATALARALLRRGHDIDLGYAQINASNLAPYRISVARAFDPCTNLATGSKILRAAYAGARRKFGPGQIALAHALSAYNSGGYYASMGYARSVYATAAALRTPHALHAPTGAPNAPGSGRAVAFHRGPAARTATK